MRLFWKFFETTIYHIDVIFRHCEWKWQPFHKWQFCKSGETGCGKVCCTDWWLITLGQCKRYRIRARIGDRDFNEHSVKKFQLYWNTVYLSVSQTAINQKNGKGIVKAVQLYFFATFLWGLHTNKRHTRDVTFSLPTVKHMSASTPLILFRRCYNKRCCTPDYIAFFQTLRAVPCIIGFCIQSLIIYCTTQIEIWR